MKPIALVLSAAAFVLGAACASIPSAPIGRPPLPADPGGGDAPAASALESQIHGLVNDRRADRALPPLQWDPRIAEAARQHSQAMASGRRPFGHDGFDARASALGSVMTMRSMAENVAYDSRDGSRLASQVVDGWILSSGHRQNIDGTFTRTGIGVARGGDGTRYFTQIFVDGD
jgi:uncharacterized protein YkwD